MSKKLAIFLSIFVFIVLGASWFGYWSGRLDAKSEAIENSMVKHYNSADCAGLKGDVDEFTELGITRELGPWLDIKKYFMLASAYQEMRDTAKEDEDRFYASLKEDEGYFRHKDKLKICNLHYRATGHKDMGSEQEELKVLFEALIESDNQKKFSPDFYYSLKSKANASQLYKKSQNMITEALAREPEMLTFLAQDACESSGSFIAYSPDSFTESFAKVLPDIYMTCAMYLIQNNTKWSSVVSINMYEHVIDKYPDSQAVKNSSYNIALAITKTTDTCSRFVLNHSAFNYEMFPGKLKEEPTYFKCALKYDKAEMYQEALAMYQYLVDNYPEGSLNKIVEQKLADASFKLAEQVGSGKIKQPDALSSKDGKTYVAIANISHDGVYITLRGAGAEQIQKDLPSVASCKNRSGYSFIGVKPGLYDILARSHDESVRPFRGKWAIEKGKTYPLCLYIKTESK